MQIEKGSPPPLPSPFHPTPTLWVHPFVGLWSVSQESPGPGPTPTPIAVTHWDTPYEGVHAGLSIDGGERGTPASSHSILPIQFDPGKWPMCYAPEIHWHTVPYFVPHGSLGAAVSPGKGGVGNVSPVVQTGVAVPRTLRMYLVRGAGRVMAFWVPCLLHAPATDVPCPWFCPSLFHVGFSTISWVCPHLTVKGHWDKAENKNENRGTFQFCLFRLTDQTLKMVLSVLMPRCHLFLLVIPPPPPPTRA